MAFKARVHEYNGRESVQLQIADIKTRK